MFPLRAAHWLGQERRPRAALSLTGPASAGPLGQVKVELSDRPLAGVTGLTNRQNDSVTNWPTKWPTVNLTTALIVTVQRIGAATTKQLSPH